MATIDKRSVKPPFFHIPKPKDVYCHRRQVYEFKPLKFNRRVDPIRTYSESMYKLGGFAPEPRKAVPRALP